MWRSDLTDKQDVSDDPAIFFTTILGVVIGAFAFLRVLATERQDRLAIVKSIHEAEHAEAAKTQDPAK